MIFVAKKIKEGEASKKNPSLLWRRSYSLLETEIFQLVPEHILEGHRLAKFIRDAKICPCIEIFKDVEVTDDAYGFVSSYLLKTSAFNEILDVMESTGRLQNDALS